MKYTLAASFLLVVLVNISAFCCTQNKESSTLQAKNYLVKTSRLVGVAHMTVKQTKKYTGDLALAVKHQRKAIALYQAQNFDEAIYHSKRSRMLCIKIFNDNKIKQPWDAKFTPEEESLVVQSPAEQDLDAKLDASELKDEDLMNGNLLVEVK